jgi:hypothetical protein
MATIQSGSPFSVVGSSTANAYWAQVSRVRVDFAPGQSIDIARKEGSGVMASLTRFITTKLKLSVNEIKSAEDPHVRWCNRESWRQPTYVYHPVPAVT